MNYDDVLVELQTATGFEFFDYQLEAITAASHQLGGQQRLCLYYKTGAGKSITALACVSLWGHSDVVVIAPPSTHQTWEKLGTQLGMNVTTMSHAKFRRQDTLLSRTTAVIADEMHLFGGHAGKGWKKLDKLAMHLKAPMVLASATPNYNDAERVYCIQHILDPHSVKGGYIAFVYANCLTEENPFGRMPKVTGFIHHQDAAAYLASLPKVEYLPDDLVYTIEEVPIPVCVPPEFDEFGLNARKGRIIASQMEERHARVDLAYITNTGRLQDHVYAEVKKIFSTSPTTLVFAVHATVAEALGVSLRRDGVGHEVVTGALSKAVKQNILDQFVDGQFDVLVGTASLATGTDGLDQVCDTLVILDDTDDNALRRQLIGRIMPRGTATNAHSKQVFRLTPYETSSNP